MKNYNKTHVSEGARTELHDLLGLTGAEISLNTLPTGAGVPFVHKHTNNEEVYGVLAGKGHALIDGETVELNTGDWVVIQPNGARQFCADADSSITFVCIQTDANSLKAFTADDAKIVE